MSGKKYCLHRKLFVTFALIAILFIAAARVRDYLIVDDGTNTVRIGLDGDRLYHDTDNDGVKDAGEEYLDFPGDVTSSGSQTLTNKTVDGDDNTVQDLAVTALKDGTDGRLITWGSDGVATTVSTGNSGQVLQSNGTGAAPTFEDASGQTLRGYIDGLITANNGTDADHDIDIAAGIASVTDGTTHDYYGELSSTVVGQIDAAWAVGTAAGKLDGTESSAGTPDADTWYHIWFIYRSDTGVTDWCFSENATGGPSIDATPIPVAYDYYRRIGAVLTDGSSNILGYTQIQETFTFDVPIYDYSGTVGTSEVTHTLSVPSGIKTFPIFCYSVTKTNPNYWGLVRSDDQDNSSPSSTIHNVSSADPYNSASVNVYLQYNFSTIHSNTSGQIKSRFSSNASVKIITSGWIDPRGKDQ